MVPLVVCALHHDPHKAQRLELNDLLGVGAGDGELDPVRQVFRFGVPANLAEFVHMRGDHALDRVKCAALSGHGNLNTVVESALRSRSAHRHLVHIDQVLT